jgi:hypothetical protein
MDKKSRAMRRHHSERMYQKSKWVNSWVDKAHLWGMRPNPWTEEERRAFHRRHQNNLAICSCHGCGNVRKHWNVITRQEYVNNLSYNEFLEEVSEDFPDLGFSDLCKNRNYKNWYW